MRLMLFFGAAALTCAVPAAACYTGPMPVAFTGRSSHLTPDSKRYLASYADDRGLNGNDRLLVIFYGGVPRQGFDTTLRRGREKAVLSYLQTLGVPFAKVSLVTTKKPMEGWLEKLGHGNRPVASVELTVGCN